MAEFNVIAQGPTPPRPVPDMTGLGVGIGAMLGGNLMNRRLAKQLDPMRAALELSIQQQAQAGVPFNAQQQMVAAAVPNARDFARLAGSQVGAVELGGLFNQQAPTPTHHREVMVRYGDPLNQLLGVGLQEGESALVKIPYDANDRMLPGFETSQLSQPSPTRRAHISAIVAGEQQPSTLLFDPLTGTFERTHPDGRREQIPSSMVQQVTVAGTREQVLPPTRADDLQAQLDWLDYQQVELMNMIGTIEQDPTAAGAGGLIRRGVQQVIGVADDISTLLGQVGATRAAQVAMNAERAALSEVERGTMTEEQFNSLFNDPKLSEIQLFENTLTYTLARLRVPEGRLLASVINDSRRDAKLVGLTSSADVLNRLRSVQAQLDARQQSIRRRLGGAPVPLPITPPGASSMPPPGTPKPMSTEELLKLYDPQGGQELPGAQ